MNGIAAPIPENHIENGREFHGYRKGIYMYPCDELEKDRMDIYHKLFLVARQEQLHKAPLVPSYEGPRILDLGTGTGIWAIDMADKFRTAEVVGLDLVNIQPQQYLINQLFQIEHKLMISRIPPNLRFRIPRDYESLSWSLGEDSWDLIHLRMAYGSVSSWSEMYQKIFLHLKPKVGYLEQVEVDLRPRCDDGTLPHRPVVEWYEWLEDATGRASRSIRYQENTCQMLQAQGFVDVEDTVIRLPVNSWPSDPHLKDVGRWYNLGMCEGLEAMSLGPLTRVYRWSAADVRRLVGEVRAAICNKNIHAYNNL